MRKEKNKKPDYDILFKDAVSEYEKELGKMVKLFQDWRNSLLDKSLCPSGITLRMLLEPDDNVRTRVTRYCFQNEGLEDLNRKLANLYKELRRECFVSIQYKVERLAELIFGKFSEKLIKNREIPQDNLDEARIIFLAQTKELFERYQSCFRDVPEVNIEFAGRDKIDVQSLESRRLDMFVGDLFSRDASHKNGCDMCFVDRENSPIWVKSPKIFNFCLVPVYYLVDWRDKKYLIVQEFNGGDFTILEVSIEKENEKFGRGRGCDLGRTLTVKKELPKTKFNALFRINIKK